MIGAGPTHYNQSQNSYTYASPAHYNNNQPITGSRYEHSSSNKKQIVRQSELFFTGQGQSQVEVKVKRYCYTLKSRPLQSQAANHRLITYTSSSH